MAKEILQSTFLRKKKVISSGKKSSHQAVKKNQKINKEKIEKEGVNKNGELKKEDGRVVKSYALTRKDVDNIKQVKEKCLNRRVVVSDSHVIIMTPAFWTTPIINFRR